jgi:phosphoserine phosphatase
LKDELGLDRIFSNELIFRNGVLDDVKINVTSDKANAVRKTLEEWRTVRQDTVAVIDGANDLSLISVAGFTVGMCPVDKVREVADGVIEIRDLTLLLNLLEKKFGKAVLAEMRQE